MKIKFMLILAAVQNIDRAPQGREWLGFGIDRVVPEQSAALRALAVIGSRDAAQAISLGARARRMARDR